MNWFSGTVTYLIIWWLVLFTVLPVGVQRAQEVEKGHDSGAPEKPHMWKKMLATSLISAILWAIAYFVITSGLIQIRPAAGSF
jgi:predicted secreted protein